MNAIARHQILPLFVYSTKVLHQFQIELLNVCSTKLSTKYFGFSTKLFEDPKSPQRHCGLCSVC